MHLCQCNCHLIIKWLLTQHECMIEAHAITNAWLNWSLPHSSNIQRPSRDHFDTFHHHRSTSQFHPCSLPVHAPLETSTSVHWFLVQLLLDFYSFSRHLECWDFRHTFCSLFLFSASWPELSQSSPCHWFTFIPPNLKWFWALWSQLNYSLLIDCCLCC